MSDFEQAVGAGRTYDFSIALYEADGVTPLVLATEDVVLVLIGRGGVVSLEVTSANPTANGSSVTLTTLDPAVCNLHFAQGDMNGLLGTYDCEVLIQDSAETAPPNAAKTASMGVLHVLGPAMAPV